MSDRRIPPGPEPAIETPRHRPSKSFWPYVDVPEEPTDEELAALDPDLHEELYGPIERPFSITLSFAPFDGDDYERAVALAQASGEYRTVGSGEDLRHRARFYPGEVTALHELFGIVGRTAGCEVLIDDRPMPFARELWLPLLWFLLPRGPLRA